MRRILVLVLSTLAIAGLSAHHNHGFGWRSEFGQRGPFGMPVDAKFFTAEVLAVESELGGRKFGEFSLNELKPFMNRLSVAEKKDAYVRGAAFSSFMLPGLGQFNNGNSAGGFGFLGLHLLTVTGTILGAYFLLPEDLRFDKLDYWNGSAGSIKNAWDSKRISDLLPSMGTLMAGIMLDITIRFFSARSAADDAQTWVKAGKVTFEPAVGPYFIGLDMRMP